MKEIQTYLLDLKPGEFTANNLMSGQRKKSAAATHYFEAARNYGKVVEAEADFFRALIKNKDNLRLNYSCHQALNNANSFLADPMGRALDVMVEFQVKDPRNQATHTMFLGTKLSPPALKSEPLVTHFACLGDESNLLTKIHHDRDFNPDAAEKKPLIHLQMGGGVGQSLAKKTNGSCCWREDISKPRMPSIPLSTALLWHWVFLEFPDAEQIAPILNAWWWKQIVQEAEESVLKPFFEDGSELIRQKPQKGLLNAFYFRVDR